MERGAVIVENCAVRTLSTAAGRVSGVITERGEIRCEQVLLAGGYGRGAFSVTSG
jgi:glycine/D-amino acid oxidase-like deaminating enzyme